MSIKFKKYDRSGPEVLFLNFANICGGETIFHKRWLTVLMLSTVSGIFIASVMFALSMNGYDVMSWISDLWPWDSDNVRSFKNIGYAYLLLLWPPAIMFWWRIGRLCESDIKIGEVHFLSILLFGLWFLFNVLGVIIISARLGQHVLAVILQALGYFALVWWFRHHPVVTSERECRDRSN